MTICFIAFLAVFLDFNLPLVAGGMVNLLPDFLGYAIFLVALTRYPEQNLHFHRSSLTAAIAIPFSLAEFVLNITAFSLPKAGELIFSIVMTLFMLYVSYEFTEGAKALEQERYQKLETDKISAAWIILCLSCLFEYLAIYLPAVALPSYIVHWIAMLWFVIAVFQFERKLSSKKK